ncbi:MAG: oxalyl-CoA decarboxylase [Planctomycetaceae bacterium]|nr:oxalyl-CoA decarboxylase [Planctomycetaceae bacterium]
MEINTNSSRLTNGFHLLVDSLKLNGLDTMFGVAGIPVTDLARLAQAKGIRYIGFHNEASAGNAAAIAGYLTQKPGICLTVSAPGFLNGMVALANATTNAFPMIQISGSRDRAIVDLQQGDDEELDQMNAGKPYAKAAYRVNRAEDIGIGLARAIRAAVSGRPGGVYLDLPASVLSATVDTESAARTLVCVIDAAPRQLPAPGEIQPRTAWVNELVQSKQTDIERVPAHLVANHNPMNFYSALAAIKVVLADRPDVYLVNERANTLDIARNVIDMRTPLKRLDSGTWGVMGIGRGYAIGAAVVSGKPVVAIEGDSTFGFSGMEIETICRYHLPIVTVVFNNGGIERGNDVKRSEGVAPAPPVLMNQSRYDKFIEAFGGDGYQAFDPQGLTTALTEALASGKSSLIDCAIDPNAATENGHIRNLDPQCSIAQSK